MDAESWEVAWDALLMMKAVHIAGSSFVFLFVCLFLSQGNFLFLRFEMGGEITQNPSNSVVKDASQQRNRNGDRW